MAEYRISGVWVNDKKVVTHYALHTVNTGSTSRAVKTSKPDAIDLVGNSRNLVYTWIWNYQKAGFEKGQLVEVVNSTTGKYLRSDRNSTLSDNLKHLIDLDWIFN